VGVTVGRVTAVAWPSQQALAVGLAQAADAAAPFPGVGPLPDRPIRVILAPTRATFDSLTRGRLPGWSEGAAFPDAGTIVLLSDHPSGYAAVAAGEWDRLDALRLNWQVARGVQLDLDELDRALRSDRPDATTAYALATTAVLLLERWGGGHGLEPFIDYLTRDATLDAALRHTYHVTEGDFEARWQRDVAARYGWLGWASAVGLFWAALGLVLIWLVRLRRRRDRARRALLDEGWTLPQDDEPTA